MKSDPTQEPNAARKRALEAVSAELDRQYAFMQTEQQQKAIDRFFEMTPEELGLAAMLAATRELD